MNADDIRRKFLGGLLGSALGDAIGELGFRYRTKPKLLEALEKSDVLRYTDDTAMAIALAEHTITLKENRGADMVQAHQPSFKKSMKPK